MDIYGYFLRMMQMRCGCYVKTRFYFVFPYTYTVTAQEKCLTFMIWGGSSEKLCKIREFYLGEVEE
jgi:hypothetical protein